MTNPMTANVSAAANKVRPCRSELSQLKFRVLFCNFFYFSGEDGKDAVYADFHSAYTADTVRADRTSVVYTEHISEQIHI